MHPLKGSSTRTRAAARVQDRLQPQSGMMGRGRLCGELAKQCRSAEALLAAVRVLQRVCCGSVTSCCGRTTRRNWSSGGGRSSGRRTHKWVGVCVSGGGRGRREAWGAHGAAELIVGAALEVQAPRPMLPDSGAPVQLSCGASVGFLCCTFLHACPPSDADVRAR